MVNRIYIPATMKAFTLILIFAASAVNPIWGAARIVGGDVTSVHEYPFAAPLLRTNDLVTYTQQCGGSIINNRSILTAAHCVSATIAWQWRIRVGSTWANDGGVVHNTGLVITHPNFNAYVHDIAILHSLTAFVFIDITVQSVAIASTTYTLPDNTAVRAIGWGEIYSGGPTSEQLRHVEVRTVNQAVCRERYAELFFSVTDDMVCTGLLDVGGSDVCNKDGGGPLLFHDGQQFLVFGIYSLGYSCGHPYYPRVNTRVSSYTTWIQANA